MRLRSSTALRSAGVLLLTTAMACSPPPPLRVATSGDYPPFTLAERWGAISGFEAVVAHQFARDLGREMRFVPLSWPNLVEQAQADGFDVAMSGVTMRADRLVAMLFSRPYATTGAVVALTREKAVQMGALELIDRPGVRLAVNRGGHLERVARAHFDNCEIVLVDKNRLLPEYVLRGEVDAALSDRIEVSSWPQETFMVIGPLTRDRKAYAVTPDRLELLDQLNRWLAARESDGWLNDQRRRWLGEDAAWTPRDACFEAIAAAIDMRMRLMPWVAVAKRNLDLPIEDAGQEERVIEQVSRWANEAGLATDGVIALFQQLMFAAKAAQRDGASFGDDTPFLPNLDALRRAIAYQSRSLIQEAARCEPYLVRADSRALLENILRRDAAAGWEEYLPPARMASLLARLHLIDPVQDSTPRGTVEFCIPSELRLDREGYSAQELLDAGGPEGTPGEPKIGGRTHTLRPGATSVEVPAGRHEFQIYVDNSSGDPHRIGGATTPPTRVSVEVPANRIVTVRYQPVINATGAFEVRWQDVYGAAYGTLRRHSGTTRFDVETYVYEPSSGGRCPF